jgi:hypothetical protein
MGPEELGVLLVRLRVLRLVRRGEPPGAASAGRRPSTSGRGRHHLPVARRLGADLAKPATGMLLLLLHALIDAAHF